MTTMTSLDMQIEALEEYTRRRKDVASFVLTRYQGMPFQFLTTRAEEVREKLALAEKQLLDLRMSKRFTPAEPPRMLAQNPQLFFTT